MTQQQQLQNQTDGETGLTGYRVSSFSPPFLRRWLLFPFDELPQLQIMFSDDA